MSILSDERDRRGRNVKRYEKMEIVRMQFELPRDKADELDVLMSETGIGTKKELFNNALTLLKWALKETRRGNTIASIDEKHGKYRELQMPILDISKASLTG